MCGVVMFPLYSLCDDTLHQLLDDKKDGVKLELLDMCDVVMFPLYSLCDEIPHQLLDEEKDGCQA